MSTNGMPIPLIPDPLIPLKEKTSGINGRGLKSPPSDSVDSGERESTGINGNQRAGLNAWTDADITAFLERQSRLVRLGWSVLDAERLAERLVQRDRGGDTRVACVECRHYRPSRCGNHRAAGLWAADVGRDLATLLQHCPGFSAGVTDESSAKTLRPAPSLTAAGRHQPINPPPGDRNA